MPMGSNKVAKFNLTGGIELCNFIRSHTHFNFFIIRYPDIVANWIFSFTLAQSIKVNVSYLRRFSVRDSIYLTGNYYSARKTS